MIYRVKSIARYFFFAAAMLAATACESTTSPIARAAGDDAQYGKSTTQLATLIVVSAPDISAGQALDVTATLYTEGHPLGGKKLTISVDGGAAMTATATRLGTAKWTVSGLAAGTHTIVAQFAGTSGYVGSSTSTTVTVNP